MSICRAGNPEQGGSGKTHTQEGQHTDLRQRGHRWGKDNTQRTAVTEIKQEESHDTETRLEEQTENTEECKDLHNSVLLKYFLLRPP